MKQDSRVWVALLGLVMLVFSAAPASAIAYTPYSGWQMFTTVADVASPYPGSIFGPLGGTTTFGAYPDNDPFTFTLTVPSILQITDVFETGDRFVCWDNGVPYTATTASTWVYGGSVLNPNTAYSGGGAGGATYSTTVRSYPKILAAGSHSLQFQNYFFKDGAPAVMDNLGRQPDAIADAYFRVAPVPEPGTMALMGLGLAFAGLVIRRKR